MSKSPGNAEPQLRINTEHEWYSRGYLPHRDCFSPRLHYSCLLVFIRGSKYFSRLSFFSRLTKRIYYV